MSDLESQKQLLFSILAQSPAICEIISEAPRLALPESCVGAGAIAQTVWNHLLGLDPLYGISDVDFVYYDPSDLSYEAEDVAIRRVRSLFGHLPVELDIKNQARVHLWYPERFGFQVPAYESLEHSISTWPTTVTSIGVRKAENGWNLIAPFGLDDLFRLTVRANKVRIPRDVYELKCARWRAKWPQLTIVPWEES